MSSIFIIGNGFDVAHGLKTSYEEFHKYLINEYPNDYDSSVPVPWSTIMPDGSEEYDTDEVLKVIMKVINEAEGQLWSNLEHSLGLLDLCEFFDDYSDDNDDNEWHEVYNNEDIATNLINAILQVTEFFDDWISTIDVCDAKYKPDFESLINKKKDYFLTFNYTETLEELYNVEKVCHIHGKQNEKLYFGHGNDGEYYENYIVQHIGSENVLGDMHRMLRKNTAMALDENRDFFESFQEIDKIYSYGFSFSDVDMVYIKEICSAYPTENIIWYIHDYESTKFDFFKEKIINCGFNGKFDMFTV